MYHRRLFSVLIITFLLAASLGFVPGRWDGVTPAQAQVSAGRCIYYAYIPLALRDYSGGSSTSVPSGFTPPDADFNGDGYADVAIGVPREDVIYDGSDHTDAGAVNILYGTGNGLGAEGNQIFTQKDVFGLNPPVPEDQDFFGQALATGDFDGNGCTDLAVGAPGEGIGGSDDAGAVYVFYGTPAVDGLDTSSVQAWHQDVTFVQDDIEANDNFGDALGVGDFNSDGYDDLAIGVPFEEIDGNGTAGAVHVLYGSSSGLTATVNQFFDQSGVAFPDEPEPVDLFGSAFAVGDYDGDGYQDLAIGVPGEDNEMSGATDAGAVWIIFGSSNGLSVSDIDGGPGTIQDEHLGSSLAAGDFNADGYTDLAIGAPNNSDQATNAGRVLIQFRASQGVAEVNTLDQGDDAAFRARFGASLTVGDFDADGFADLVIGIPGESSITSDAGAAWVLYGVDSERPDPEFYTLNQQVLPVESAEENDEFGSALTAGDYNGDGPTDLIISVPVESLEDEGAYKAGLIHEVQGVAESGLTILGSYFWTQDTSDIDGDIKGTAESNDFFGDALR
jgi:hypothetical protein